MRKSKRREATKMASAEAIQLEKELAYFERHRSELLLRAKGQFALVNNDSIIAHAYLHL